MQIAVRGRSGGDHHRAFHQSVLCSTGVDFLWGAVEIVEEGGAEEFAGMSGTGLPRLIPLTQRKTRFGARFIDGASTGRDFCDGPHEARFPLFPIDRGTLPEDWGIWAAAARHGGECRGAAARPGAGSPARRPPYGATTRCPRARRRAGAARGRGGGPRTAGAAGREVLRPGTRCLRGRDGGRAGAGDSGHARARASAISGRDYRGSPEFRQILPSGGAVKHNRPPRTMRQCNIPTPNRPQPLARNGVGHRGVRHQAYCTGVYAGRPRGTGRRRVSHTRQPHASATPRQAVPRQGLCGLCGR